MKNIKFKVILCFIILASKVSAQNDKIQIVLLRGAAIIENSGSRIELEKSNRITLQKNAKVKLLPNSNIIAYNSKVKIEFGGTKEQELSFIKINTALKKIKQQSITVNFIAYLDKMYLDIEDKNHSYGASIGAASRGIGDIVFNYLPKDESIILSDSVILLFDSEVSKLSSNIMVTIENTNEIVYDDRPLVNQVKLNKLKPGKYNWTYTIESFGKKVSFKNTFSVPEIEVKKIKLKEIFDFNTQLNNCRGCFSVEAKKILMSDFLESKSFYVN
jgi:hypothetical protein